MADSFTLADCLFRPRPQLCWDCKKACGGCSWSKNFEPVPGWQAEKRVLYNAKIPVVSYHITACPEFEQEAPRDPTCY